MPVASSNQAAVWSALFVLALPYTLFRFYTQSMLISSEFCSMDQPICLGIMQLVSS